MSCSTCKCNFCAHSCELYVEYVTIGEVDECCFTCDECKHYDGDYSKRSMWRPECPHYVEPRKFAEMLARYAEKKAKLARSKLRIVRNSEKGASS